MSLPGMPEVDIPASEGPMPHSAYQDLDPHQMQSQSASLIVAEQQNNLSQEGYSAGTIVIRYVTYVTVSITRVYITMMS
jgi:hypothetical protein